MNKKEREREEQKEREELSEKNSRALRASIIEVNKALYVHAQIAKKLGMTKHMVYRYLKIHEKVKLKSIILNF